MTGLEPASLTDEERTYAGHCIENDSEQRDDHYLRQDALTHTPVSVRLPDGTTITEKPPSWFRRAALDARRSYRARISPRPRARRSRASRRTTRGSADDDGEPGLVHTSQGAR
jgi:hypothetical protein